MTKICKGNKEWNIRGTIQMCCLYYCSHGRYNCFRFALTKAAAVSGPEPSGVRGRGQRRFGRSCKQKISPAFTLIHCISVFSAFNCVSCSVARLLAYMCFSYYFHWLADVYIHARTSFPVTITVLHVCLEAF